MFLPLSQSSTPQQALSLLSPEALFRQSASFTINTATLQVTASLILIIAQPLNQAPCCFSLSPISPPSALYSEQNMLLKHKLDPINPPAYNLSLDRWCFQNKTQALCPGHEALCDLVPATHCGLFFGDSAEILLTPGHLHLLCPLPGKALSLELHQAGSFSFCGLNLNAPSSARQCRPLCTPLSTKRIPTPFASTTRVLQLVIPHSFAGLLVGFLSHKCRDLVWMVCWANSPN